MLINHTYKVKIAPVIALMVAACSLVSCNAHEKAVRFISNTICEEVNQLNLNTNLKVCNPMQTIGKLIKSPGITEIIADKSELIATQ